MNIIHELKYVVLFCLLTLLLFVLFIIVLAVHEYYLKSDIIFYAYMKISLVFAVMSGSIMIIFRKTNLFVRNNISLSLIVSSIINFIVLSYAFNMTFPVTIDRSFSVYMLGQLSRYEYPMPMAELESIVSSYFHERKLVGKRINEQLATGSIIVEDDKVILTQRGRDIVKMNVMFANLFNLDMRNVK